MSNENEMQFQLDNEEKINDIELEAKYLLLKMKFDSLINYTESIYNENKELKYYNMRLRSQLSSTSKNLAEKEKMFLLLKSIHNNTKEWKQ